MWLQYDCIYTARGHIRVRFLHVRSSRGAMNTSIGRLYWLCVSYIQTEDVFLCKRLMVHGLALKQTHTHTQAHTYGVTECTGWAQMNQWQPGEGGMCMALVQERPSESSAGNPGCLSEHKCECVKVCASAQEGGRCSNCRTIWVCIILQTVWNGLPLHMYGETLSAQSLYCFCQFCHITVYEKFLLTVNQRTQSGTGSPHRTTPVTTHWWDKVICSVIVGCFI